MSARLFRELPPTNPELRELLARARNHVMTPAERHAQRRSWVIGQMGLSHPEMSRSELEALADQAVGPAPIRQTAEQVAALANAMWQLLNDMHPGGQSVCLAAKAQARIAYEPFREELEGEIGIMRLDEARAILAE